MILIPASITPEDHPGAADAVFPILLATYQGTAAVEPKLVWSARAAGCAPRRALFTVVLMAALPSVLTGCRIGLIISCIVVFLAEMITSTDGLGYLLVRAGRNFQTVDMFVPLISISILGPDAQRGVQYTARVFADADFRGTLMLADRIEGNGSTPFARCFERCAVKRATPPRSCRRRVAPTQRAPRRAGAAAPSARPFHIVLPTPRNRHPVPVRSRPARARRSAAGAW
jgi:hypothetical protein